MLLLPRVLTHEQTQDVLTLFNHTLHQQALLSGPKDTTLIVDASQLEKFDSSALAVLMLLRRRAIMEGRAADVRNLPMGLQALAKLYGVQDLLAPSV